MKRNAQILLSLALTLAVCLGLCIPAAAADTDGLNSTEASAYLDVINKYYPPDICYIRLCDMDNNGKPELILITVEKEDRYSAFGLVTVNIWTIKNGSVYQVSKEEFEYKEADFSLVKAADGKAYVEYYLEGYLADYETYVGADGTADEFILYYEENRNAISDYRYNGNSVTKSVYDSAYSAYQGRRGLDPIYLDDRADTNVVKISLLTVLQKGQNNSTATASTYGSYTIVLDGYPVTFSAAKVEKKSVMVRSCFERDREDGIGLELDYTPYVKENVTLITLRPNSTITVHGADMIDAVAGTYQGNNQYEEFIAGAYEAILAGSVEETFREKNSLRIPASVTDADGDRYFVVLGSNSTTATVSGFTDVQANAYYADAVKWAVGKGITSGTTATTFSPNSTCTNAQILTFLWRAYGSPEPTIKNPFSNIKTTDYYYKAALWAKEKGMVSGSTFNASGLCTRAAAVTYMWKAAGSPNTSSKTSFTDVSSTASYAKAVAWAVNKGITSGTTATTFSPNQTCTRGQIVTFLYRGLA